VSYVIASYGITAAVLLGYAWSLWRERRRLRGG
jgi:heme exporter protein CcmD